MTVAIPIQRDVVNIHHVFLTKMLKKRHTGERKTPQETVPADHGEAGDQSLVSGCKKSTQNRSKTLIRDQKLKKYWRKTPQEAGTG